MSKLQFLFTTRHLPPYMAEVHQDDREMGTVTRVWDRPSPDHPVALVVIGPQPKDLSVDLVLEEARRIGDIDVAPVRVEFDGADDAMWINQDDSMIKVRSTEQAIEIAMRLLLWARLEQEKQDGTN